MDQRRRRRRPARGRKQSRRRRKRNLILKTGFFIIVIIAAVAAFFLWRRYGPSDEQADRNGYYGIESDGQLAIVVNNEVLEPRGMLSDGRAYVEYAIVRDYINSRFYWDPGENVLLYTLPTDTVSVGVGASEYTLANQKTGTDYVILRTEGSTAYIALDFVAQYTDMSYEVFTDPDRAVVVTETEETVAEVKRDTQVRYQGGVKSPILTEVSKGDTVAVIEDEGDWKKVRTQDGFIGYVKQNRLRMEKVVEKTTICPASCQSAPWTFRAITGAVTGEGEAKRIRTQSSSISRKPIHTARGMKMRGRTTIFPRTAPASCFLLAPIPAKLRLPPRTTRLTVVAQAERFWTVTSMR